MPFFASLFPKGLRENTKGGKEKSLPDIMQTGASRQTDPGNGVVKRNIEIRRRRIQNYLGQSQKNR